MQLSQLPNGAKIGIAVGCLALAGGILWFTTLKDMVAGDGGGINPNEKIYLLCTNQQCNAVTEMTQAEFQKMMQNSGAMVNPMMMGAPGPFTCPKCNQATAYLAQKCPKCGAVFISQNRMMPSGNGDYPDRCPKCGYSQLEEDVKKDAATAKKE